jgi:hypothetical protein
MSVIFRAISPLCILLWLLTGAEGAPRVPVPLVNNDFSQGADAQGVPLGWQLYGGSAQAQLRYEAGEQAVLLDDQDAAAEVGLSQAFAVQPGVGYEVRVKVRAFADRPSGGAFLQFLFQPSGEYVQVSLSTKVLAGFGEIVARAMAPPGARQARLYLYTHREPTPKLLLSEVTVVSGIDPPPPPPPLPVPPVYDQLKDLHLSIPLVQGGQPAISLVSGDSAAYRKAAEIIREAVRQKTGVDLPLIKDTDPAAAVPLTGHLIVLGNRSTNRVSNQLYDHYYSLMDLKYPGPGGYSLRSLHNPYGNGYSAILVGGSDDAGVVESAQVLARRVGQAPAAGRDLSVGWLMETRLGQGLEIPTGTNVPRGACRLKPGPCRCCHDYDTWEASAGYRSVGYFGWNSISKRMAMYYMTGDPAHAREFLRLAFPDAEALKDLDEVDQERIENKQDPLAGPYHYNALMLILFWDLIEESPVFTAEERLKVTNAFARRLNHPQDKGAYQLNEVPGSVGTRHGQWSALSLYTLARYFNKYYPSPLWAHAQRAGQLHFQPLHEHEYVQGEFDYLPWYSTGIAPILTYMILSGDRRPLENGVLAKLLRGQEVLISGREPDWALNCAALDYLHKAAYLTGDGRWLTYRQRTGLDTSILRVGQSFWPDTSLQPQLPLDLVGKWTVHPMPRQMWQTRGSGLKFEESFINASYRSAPDGSGDFLLIDGMNGAYRTPHHTFPLLEYRLRGRRVLEGYYNQVLTSADGMVEPLVPMDAALLYHEVVGPVAVAVAEVANMPFCSWRRTLAHRTGHYGLIADDLTFRTDSQNMKVQTAWEGPSAAWDPEKQAVCVPVAGTASYTEIRPSQLQPATGQGAVIMTWDGSVKQGEHRRAFTLIGQPEEGGLPLECLQIAPGAAALSLPEPAVASLGDYRHNRAELAIVATDHLYGHAMVSAGLSEPLLQADQPVEVEWSFPAGKLTVLTAAPTTLKLWLAAGEKLQLGGQPVTVTLAGGWSSVSLPAGRHELTGAMPGLDNRAALAALVAEGRVQRQAQTTELSRPPVRTGKPWPARWQAATGAKVSHVELMSSPQGPLLAVAADKVIHVLTPDGQTAGRYKTDGWIRHLRWWEKPRLLLAGCLDEKLIAFNEAGERQWTFISEMAPEVYEAAKQYEFKEGPGRAGIHGLTTGVFLNGEEQCFAGGACTLEIIGEQGQLIRRLPLFWGCGNVFQFVPRSNGSIDLLVAREPNDGHYLWVVNNRDFSTRRAFSGVPAGHTYVGGAESMGRDHIFHVDLDGDGTKEIVSEINGSWNRVTVWNEDGHALYNAQFGPGERIPARNMRDLDLIDLNGDGRLEIITATSEGVVVALDWQCRKLWSVRLASPGAQLKTVRIEGAPAIIIACDKGEVLHLDRDGKVVARGQVEGKATQILSVTSNGQSQIVVATETGAVAGFAYR